MSTIKSIETLREHYPTPKGRTLGKVLVALDIHCKRFIELSPFVVMSTCGATGKTDASPRGGAPGFVSVLDDKSILIPDWPGNNRLDSLENIVETSSIGLLFMIPGVDETLRINGGAELSVEDSLRQIAVENYRAPKLVIKVDIEEVYLHCAKALMRSKLWKPESLIDRSELPSMGEMINDQVGLNEPAESQDAMVARYEKVLY
ncbi:MAG: pyridoxamine 5'-phosphate oxidase family protein [Pseudomonadota bacterium]